MEPKIFALSLNEHKSCMVPEYLYVKHLVPLESEETQNSTHVRPKLLESNDAWQFEAFPRACIQEAQLLPSYQEVAEE